MEESIDIKTNIKFIRLTKIVMVTILFAGLINISSHCWQKPCTLKWKQLKSKIYPPWGLPQLGYTFI